MDARGVDSCGTKSRGQLELEAASIGGEMTNHLLGPGQQASCALRRERSDGLQNGHQKGPVIAQTVAERQILSERDRVFAFESALPSSYLACEMWQPLLLSFQVLFPRVPLPHLVGLWFAGRTRE